MRRAIAIVAAMAATLLLPVQAGAIIGGAPDGNGHPEVGALLAPVPYSDGTWAACSGTLISPTVFLTAAHCEFTDVTRYAVTFASSYIPGTSTTYWGTWHPHPDYGPAQNDPHDIAVVILDSSVQGITPALLPAAGSLDNLEHWAEFTAVGYGAQLVTTGQVFHYADIRYVATGRLFTQNKSWLRLSMVAALGDGGTCFGDSGGPNFLGAGATETNIIAATTITGDFACVATNVDYRLDTESARAFLDDFVALP
jgi:hypothetical protein